MRVILLMVLLGLGTPEPVPNLLWKQCDEDVLMVPVDPGPFRELAGDDFSLVIEDGRAQVLIAVQDCPTYRFNGEELGRTHEVHQWVAIEAPRDTRTVVGAEVTLPTMTWLAVFTGSSNPQVRAPWVESGTPSVPIQGVSLGERERSVSVGEGLRYSWSAGSGTPFARLVGVNHDVYVRGADAGLTYNRIQCLADVAEWSSPATIVVEGGTDPSGRIGPGEHSVAVHTLRPLWCRASLADKELP